jgi:hypothetical protein
MPDTFSKADCKHINEADSSCKINKGCGSGSVYCRPVWTGTRCYSLEKPNDSQLAESGYQIYAYGNTLVCRDINGRCWQLKPGDYLGEKPLEDLIFVKRAVLSS